MGVPVVMVVPQQLLVPTPTLRVVVEEPVAMVATASSMLMEWAELAALAGAHRQ